MIKKIDHFVITTAKVSECLGFYEKLGFEVKSASGRFELFAGDFKINVHVLGKELKPNANFATPGSCDFCLETTHNLEILKRDLTAKGLEIEEGVVPRTGVKGKMNSIYLRDPDGNLVELSCYP